MTDPERDLRTHLHEAPLPQAPTTLRVSLHRIADGEPPAARRRVRRRTIVLLAAAALLVVGGGALGAGGALDGLRDLGRDNKNAIVVRSPAATAVPPNETPLPSFAIASPDGACPTETVRILTGAEMPRAVASPGTVARGVHLRGAYVTTPADGSYVPADLWVASNGTFRRIASVIGSVNWVWVTDVSRDGSWVLLSIGRLSPSGAHTECVDLYAFAADGTDVRRITENTHGQVATDGRFSSDGRFVAFRQYGIAPDPSQPGSSLTVWDRTTGTTRGLACGISPSLAWAPSDPRVAALCDGAVLVVDALTAEAGTTALATADPWAVAWTSPGTILVASDQPGVAADLITQSLQLATAGLTGSVGSPVRVSLSGEPVSGTLSVEPGTGALLVQTDTVPPGAADVWGWGLDRAAPGRGPVQVAETGVVDAQWTDAGDGFLVQSIVSGIRRIDLHGLKGTVVASVADTPDDVQSVVIRAAGMP